MRIDAHIHFWRTRCGFDNRPIADHEAYRRDFMPADVEDDLGRCAIDAVILVQTCPQVDETAWLVDLARDSERIAGVTGWVDLDDPRCDFSPLLAERKLVGIRAQLRRIADPAFIERPQVLRNLGTALRANLGVTLLAEPRHYAHVARALDALPPGPITLNHLGLRFAATDATQWRAAMREFARRDDCFVQLSGLPFLYAERWRDAAALAVLDEAFDILGPSRLVFASDWPMLVRFASYADWVRTVDEFLVRRGVARHDVDAIFAGNVRRANPRLSLPTLAGTS
ncbi:MAG TPA: amidohydrolase family protein [Casimicrobiaceae bacterium]|nr:amidohydrolase family protein [Casimicrobiaceae bacterium]